jgi:hypothetical protein
MSTWATIVSLTGTSLVLAILRRRPGRGALALGRREVVELAGLEVSLATVVGTDGGADVGHDRLDHDLALVVAVFV